MTSAGISRGSSILLADTSAWTRAHHPAVRDEWGMALRGDRIATCPIVQLELLYSARDGASFDAVADDLAQLRNVPVTRSVTHAAIHALRRLAYVHAGSHRSVKLPDLLVAACAQDAAIGVLHYDEDFDRLAGILEFESRWLAEPGTL